MCQHSPPSVSLDVVAGPDTDGPERVHGHPFAESWLRVSRGLALPLVGLLRLYQWTLSPLIGNQCRFYPTCSNYALEALRVHGVLRGSWLMLHRLARCQPFGAGGLDPVPGHPTSPNTNKR